MPKDIGDWLVGLGLDQYKTLFDDNEIDLSALPYISEDDLKDIGVALGARRKILAAIPALGRDQETAIDQSQASEAEALPAPASEKRQVTVLFADLTGFTALSAELGAEKTHALLNRYFELVDGIVEGYGGSIDKHIGDNVMAVFGAPIAHSDDPERAVRGALDIHDVMAKLSREFGRTLQAHIGIASGQVVASGTGSNNYREYTVTGSSVNLASRLQDEAGPGETFLSPEVKREVTSRFECSLVGEVSVKGLDNPVRAWRLIGLSQEAAIQQRSRFVGRRNERRQFAALIEECLEAGDGQVVLVRGEAGIGKTRLIAEFSNLAERQGFACHKGLVLDFGVGKGQDEIRKLVRSCLGVADLAANEQRARAVDEAIETGLVAENERVFLNDLLDLEQSRELRAVYDAMDNATRNEGKQATVSKLINGLSRKRPLLIAIEDVHWASDLTLGYLAKLGAAISDSPVILVMTSRIENDPLDQAWRASLRGSPLTTFDLQPLRRTEAEELVGGLVQTDSDFVRDCIERSGGNPLFLEQLMWNAEEGDDSEIPGSIQSLILARMDRLEQRDKQALQAASVVGQRFSLEVLKYLIDDSTFDAKNLFKQALIRPEGDGCMFSHALIQEGVYGSLLQSSRTKLHLRAANWFETRDVVLFAEHLDRAGDPRAPGGYLAAARAQASSYHYERAISLVNRGLQLAEDLSDRISLTCIYGELLNHQGEIEESVAAFRNALALASGAAEKVAAWLGVADGLRMLDDYDGVMNALDEAQILAQGQDFMRELSQIHHQRGNLFFPLGRIEECLVEHERALDAARSARAPDCEAQALGGLGDANYARGRMATAGNYIARCTALAREHGLGRIQVAYSAMLGHVCIYQLELKKGASLGAQAAELAARVGHHRAENIAQRAAAACYFEMGQIEQAHFHLGKSSELVQKYRMRRFDAVNKAYEAALYKEAGEYDRALATLMDAVEISKETGHQFTGPWVLGRLAVVAKDPSIQHTALVEGEEVLRQGSVGHNHLWFYRLAIEACLESENWEAAERYATRLEDFTKQESLLWADYFISWGRALARFGRGQRDEAVFQELRRLRKKAEQEELAPPLPALDAALSLE